MATSTSCKVCGKEIPATGKRGRPALVCPECKAAGKKAPKAPAAPVEAPVAPAPVDVVPVEPKP